MATMTLTPALSPAASARSNLRTGESRAQAPVHLTRRGRLVVMALSALLVLGLGVGTANRVVAGTPAQAPALESVIVQPGQSLWQFASRSMPGTDTREAVLRIRELNGLRTSVVHPGQVLLVPAS